MPQSRDSGRPQDYRSVDPIEKRSMIHSSAKRYYIFAVKSFTELGPWLLQQPDVKYLLSEVFSQDPLEKYFSRQRHRGGGADNPTVEEFRCNTATLIQQQCVY